ncbi:mercuric transporter MerT family protein [Leclercia adecarboxylata]|uniref:mercuric transporter MerT family protein n=1 Tax=Leclercia adecarboxylata TaxID=83655 RepID=UPI002DBC8C48|nr:mercuric transporter MerT family protein [Leclercia adecarboxylata]MEB6378260.1 mercuric transporter MerT family protein [Leclercia adecarboxylata]
MSQPNNAKGAGLTLLTAAAAAVTAGLCCVGPLLYLLFGISAAGFAGLSQLEFLRVPMMVLSSALMLRVFWRLYFSKRLWCTGRLTMGQMRLLFWLSLPVLLLVLFYPTVVGWIYEVME